MLLKARNLYSRFSPPKNARVPVDVTGDASQDLIRKGLTGDRPFMVARMGFTELDCATKYQSSKLGLPKYWRFITSGINNYEIDDISVKEMTIQSGFFPSNVKNLERFSEILINDMPQVDVLGSWLHNEKFFANELRNATRIQLADIEPYYSNKPWSIALAGKKVLLIHPFEETIKAQYLKRKHLFTNPDVLPEFELKTIKAVQGIVGEKTSYNDWFEALDSMKSKIDATDFDVAIIGAGAYGFSLAAHVKRIGKKAVHMGGATQLMFGIMGRRWVDNTRVTAMVNDYWTRPSQTETPRDFKRMEDGAYW